MAALTNLAICACADSDEPISPKLPVGWSIHGPAICHSRPHFMILKRS